MSASVEHVDIVVRDHKDEVALAVPGNIPAQVVAERLGGVFRTTAGRMWEGRSAVSDFSLTPVLSRGRTAIEIDSHATLHSAGVVSGDTLTLCGAFGCGGPPRHRAPVVPITISDPGGTRRATIPVAPDASSLLIVGPLTALLERGPLTGDPTDPYSWWYSLELERTGTIIRDDQSFSDIGIRPQEGLRLVPGLESWLTAHVVPGRPTT